MKKIISLFAFIIFAISTYAQSAGPMVTSAILDYKKQDYVSAKDYIDKATAAGLESLNDKKMAKYYYHLGMIYYRIYVSEKEEIVALKDENTLDVATKALQDLIAFEKKVDRDTYTKDARGALNYCAIEYGKKGFAMISEKNYKGAADNFFTSFTIKKSEAIGITDTSSLFNAALMSENGEDYDASIKYYNMLIDFDYQGYAYDAVNVATNEVETFDNKKFLDNAIAKGTHTLKEKRTTGGANLYLLLSGVYKKKGDNENANEVIKKGRAKYPDNNALIVEEFNYYLNAKKYKEASDNLALAIQQDPENPIYYSIQGNLYYYHLEKQDEAIAILNKAIELDPLNKDANYLLGYIEVEKSNAIIREMEKLSLSQQSKYDAMDKEQKEHLKAALPYLEKAYEADNNDISVVEALKTVYYQLGDFENNKKMNQRLQELNAQ